MATSRDSLSAALAELCGTFILVFAGTGAIVINGVSSGAVTHPGIALTFGLAVLAMIHTFGPISGAHMNPAVTLALFAAGRFPRRSLAFYLGSQVAGAVLASLVLKLLFPDHATLGATIPSGSSLQSFVLELMLTWILVLVVLRLSDGPPGNAQAGLVVGSVIALEAMFAGPICGASMNPARSMGPALVSLNLQHLWIYLTAPVIGALLAVPLGSLLRIPAAGSGAPA
ncbi:MAG: MIP/aquaporin family protein [Planctomycetota bacterium]